MKKIKPLSYRTPWAWAIEVVHGCNLRCGHCSCRLLPAGKYEYMSDKTWEQCWKIHAWASPMTRVDLVLAGEPTLHPKLTELLRVARKISPLAQIQITTNGTMLLKEQINYKELLEAGANIIYTDMYGPRERFLSLAKRSGAIWYEYYSAPAGAPSPWTYHGPDLKLVVLQEQPENWPKSRFRAGLLGTWFNHLDWEAARRFGLSPVLVPPARRCNQPFIYVPVHVSGAYLLCCQDNWAETVGQFGDVHQGRDGFLRYWLGEKMQMIRRRLRDKDRKSTTYCARCCITFSRCDFVHWKRDPLDRYWNGDDWKKLNYPSNLLGGEG